MERQRNRQIQDVSEEARNLLSFNQSSFSGSETATVSHGVYAEQLPIAGQSIGRVRALYADRFDLDPYSQAIIDGNEVDDNTIIEAGQLLVFMNRAGEKGISLNKLERIAW
ncbi:hypothetical protein AYK24_07305 [Thermoplasmatales archaeon SG8-52-4]|nr:MAG: hypothetical protein AYK24_07305 [Thermoplasmatales archaeon SG8-52-4]